MGHPALLLKVSPGVLKEEVVANGINADPSKDPYAVAYLRGTLSFSGDNEYFARAALKHIRCFVRFPAG